MPPQAIPLSKRGLILVGGIIAAIFMFATAGAVRSKYFLERTQNEEFDMIDFTVERLMAAEDGNMLDGFVLLGQ